MSLNSNFIETDFLKQMMNIILTFNVFLRAMKHSKFVRFVNMLKFNIKLFRRTKFDRLICRKMNAICWNNLKKLKNNIKINVVLNNWISSNNIKFMKITTYFIDNRWKYRKTLLVFHSLYDSHIEKFMTKKMCKILKNYKIDNCLLKLICDNVLNNEKINICMKILLKILNIKWNSKINHIFCLIHVVQLIVYALLSFLKTMIKNDSIDVVFQKSFLLEINSAVNLSNTLFKINVVFYHKIL